ncbi:MAG TPA: response regulator [Aggregatilineales bacterium]|nr:response regulator [Aggregatilineales bacterium]
MKLLIVDDEAFTVDMLQTFLQINGFDTIGAFDGESGLLMAQVERPDIMILDLMLPDIEGYEVCRRLRSNAVIARLPVIVLSARIDSTSKERAFEAGVDAYLTKPVQFPLLLSEIKRLTEVKAGEVSAPPPIAASSAQSSLTAAPTPVTPTPALVVPGGTTAATPPPTRGEPPPKVSTPPTPPAVETVPVTPAASPAAPTVQPVSTTPAASTGSDPKGNPQTKDDGDPPGRQLKS